MSRCNRSTTLHRRTVDQPNINDYTPTPPPDHSPSYALHDPLAITASAEPSNVTGEATVRASPTESPHDAPPPLPPPNPDDRLVVHHTRPASLQEQLLSQFSRPTSRHTNITTSAPTVETPTHAHPHHIPPLSRHHPHRPPTAPQHPPLASPIFHPTQVCSICLQRLCTCEFPTRLPTRECAHCISTCVYCLHERIVGMLASTNSKGGNVTYPECGCVLDWRDVGRRVLVWTEEEGGKGE